jgi:uncharacterized Tic20 family protein
MTSHPTEPPAQRPPPSTEERPARHGQPPGAAEKWPARRGQRHGAPDEWPAGPRQRYPGDQPGNGHRAAAAYPANGAPAPLVDYPPETGYRQAPGHPSGTGSGPGGFPDYPDLPDYPQDSYSPRDTYFSGYPSMPDYPPMPDYPANGHPPGAYAAPDQPPGGYPARGSQVVEFPPADGGWALTAAAPVTHEEYLHPGNLSAGGLSGAPGGGADALRAPPAPAGPAAPGAAADVSDMAPGPARLAVSRDARWAMLGYLTVPFLGFLVPLAIYLTFLRRSRWLRAHAAQAVNVWLTVTLYELSAAIIGAMLVLDSPRVALTVVVPLVAALLLTALVFLARAAAAAYRGQAYAFPRWLCAPLVR